MIIHYEIYAGIRTSISGSVHAEKYHFSAKMGRNFYSSSFA